MKVVVGFYRGLLTNHGTPPAHLRLPGRTQFAPGAKEVESFAPAIIVAQSFPDEWQNADFTTGTNRRTRLVEN